MAGYKTYKIDGAPFSSLRRLKEHMRTRKISSSVVYIDTYDFRSVLISCNKINIKVRLK